MEYHLNGYRQVRREISFPTVENNKCQSKEEISTGINWGEVAEIELEEGEEFIKVNDDDDIIDAVIETLNDNMIIGNKKVNRVKFQPKENVEVTEKLTIYLPKSLIATLKLLKHQGSIESCSKCIKEALVQHLTT